jgi:dTDP-4-amino-4,6-dideoxygalactose transaminase
LKVEFCRHTLEKEDIERVQEVLNSIILTTGQVTAEFEEKFAAYTGLPYMVGLTSCTAALHLALLALKIGPGDEVITTPMTFLATATAVLHTGAKPVFVDVEPETGLIDAKKIEAAVTPRTKAILPVHLYGVMADMRAIADIAKRRGLKVIEDCAHCIEAERDGVRPGELSDAACYSFYATKNLTSGEGGSLGTRNKELADQIRILRLHGMSADAAARYTSKYKHWDMEVVGWKYNMDNIHAALLVRQIGRLDANWKKRRDLSGRYREKLSEIAAIRMPAVKGKSAYHLQTIWVNPEIRDEVISKMQAKGAGVAVNYRSVHTLRYFRETYGYQPSDFPNAHLIGQQTVSLPLYPKLDPEEIDYVIEAVKDSLAACETGSPA